MIAIDRNVRNRSLAAIRADREAMTGNGRLQTLVNPCKVPGGDGGHDVAKTK